LQIAANLTGKLTGPETRAVWEWRNCKLSHPFLRTVYDSFFDDGTYTDPNDTAEVAVAVTYGDRPTVDVDALAREKAQRADIAEAADAYHQIERGLCADSVAYMSLQLEYPQFELETYEKICVNCEGAYSIYLAVGLERLVGSWLVGSQRGEKQHYCGLFDCVREYCRVFKPRVFSATKPNSDPLLCASPFDAYKRQYGSGPDAKEALCMRLLRSQTSPPAVQASSSTVVVAPVVAIQGRRRLTRAAAADPTARAEIVEQEMADGFD